MFKPHALVALLLLVALPLFAAAPKPVAGLVSGIKVLPDKAPDCTSLKTIVESVTRGCKTNDEKAIAVYNFMRLTHYHRAYPSEPGGIPVLKEINCYGWSLCGGLHAEQSALWRELGWEWRFVGWPGHTTVEAFYDGRWHYLDVFLKFYAWMPDPNHPGGRTIAGEDDLAANPQELLLDAFVLDESRNVMYAKGHQFELIGEKANWQAPAFLLCGDDIPSIIHGVTHKNRIGAEPGWGGLLHATGDYSADVNLAPGFALTNTWDKAEGAWYWSGSQVAPCHTCGDKEIRNSPEKGPIAEPYLGPNWNCESYANGQIDFHPNLSHRDCLKSFAAVENVKLADGGLVPIQPGQPARVTVLLQSPYLLTQASGSATGFETFEISVNGGQTWKTADLKDFGPAVGGQTQALARLTIKDRLTEMHLQATVQNNPFSLPYLSPGKNTVTVSVADPAALGENTLVVTYAYRTGSRRKSYEQLCLEGKEIGRGHDASWEATPTIVQKTFRAKDLPAKFDIDIPTPRGLHPVYPRMLFVRREVLAPNQKPLPWPANSQPPQVSPGDTLLTLPNPLLTGTQPPPPKPVRPVKTVSIDWKAGRYITKSGQAPALGQLKWPKNAQEQIDPIAFVVSGELKGLPALKDLAAARLKFPVIRSHEKAPTKVGAVSLQSPFDANQPYDFGQLGDLLGTVNIPTLADADPNWSPPKEFTIDVTRHLRSLLVDPSKFHGFALRVVPDRSIDDGWTVRIQLPDSPKFTLEIDTYTDAVSPTPGQSPSTP